MLAESLETFFEFSATKWSQSSDFSSQVPWDWSALKRASPPEPPNPLQSVPVTEDEGEQEVSYWELSSLTQVLFPRAVQVFGVLQPFHSFSLFSLQKVHRSEVRHPSPLTHPLSKHLTQFLFH